MLQNSSLSVSVSSVLPILLLILVILLRLSEAQLNKGETHWNSDEHGGDTSAFFALRSCHQLLQSDNGEFFSPDYLCSNPPLWCNWTIQVDPGKRIHLHLEDLTPDESCHLKQDQIYVDEPDGHLLGHKVLQKCWREAKFTSSSNTLYVVLLIGGWPSPPYRGFYSRYQTFGPLVLYNPRDGFVDTSKTSQPSPGGMDFIMMAGMPWELEEDSDPESEVGKNISPILDDYNDVHQFIVVPTVPASTQRTSRSGRGVLNTHCSQSDSAVHPVSPQQQRDSEHIELKTSTLIPTATRAVEEEGVLLKNGSRTQRWLEETAVNETKSAGDGAANQTKPAGDGAINETKPDPDVAVNKSKPMNVDGENRTEVSPPAVERADTENTPYTPPHPNVVEPLMDSEGTLNMRNHSDMPHLPGDHLFEVTLEVHFAEGLEESWENVSTSLFHPIKALVCGCNGSTTGTRTMERSSVLQPHCRFLFVQMDQQLEGLHTHLSASTKRMKRLRAGVLYILWLQVGRCPGTAQVHGELLSALQGLVSDGAGLRGKATVVSVSTADVNECGTHLVLCDVNAVCENHFGSYSCHCRPGFRDHSRLGLGGMVCADVTAAGCSSGPSSEAKGVYVLFFLLSTLLLMLLAVAVLLYRRHHQGTFLVRCHGSSSSSIAPPDSNNNYRPSDGYSNPGDCDLPPPPPPARGPREAWLQTKERRAPVDLPLLRFSPLLPPDGYMDSQEGGKL